MASLGKKKKLAAVNRDGQGEHPMNNLSQDISAPTVNENYITQVSVQIDGSVTKKHCLKNLTRHRVPKSGRFVETGRVSSQLTSSGTIRNRSGDFSGSLQRKPIVQRGPSPEGPSS